MKPALNAPLLSAGLVSVTFRKLTPHQVIDLAVANGLAGIEWGGDLHVPHGDIETARQVRRWGDAAGVGVSAYGSYYRLGALPEAVPDFDDVLATAVALGAPSIRIWAGTVGSAAATADVRAAVTEDLIRVADLAMAAGVDVALEYHGGTLTDDPTSALQLLDHAARPNVRTYWQPRHGLPVDAGLSDIARLRSCLLNVHAFHWWPDDRTRLPLHDGRDRWAAYLADIASDGQPHVVSLEFVRDDDPGQLKADARTLHGLIAGVAV